MKILFTGAAGFIAGYAIEELLRNGHEVVGIDNNSKYGPLKKSYSDNPKYTFIEGDAKDVALMKKAIAGCDILVANAAIIGGISYFHELAYDLIAENERITTSSFDAAIWAHANDVLKKIVVVSSSAVYECTTEFPTSEGAQFSSRPPRTTYGFQKLSTEYFAKGAWEQYKLPYTIVRPFNCVGIGEQRALAGKEILSGNIKLALGHVAPDIARKILKGQDPLHILGSGNQIRHYIYGGDLARGMRLCVESEKALNEDFNISTARSTTVLQLAELIWKRINPGKPFNYVSDNPFADDVQKRIPDISKAKNLLGFEATTTLEEMLDEVVPWIKGQVENGNI
ncbi:MAG: NAD(P)-dependent oxidoreductase [Minisyncoccia bacterium]|jgi:nucleoside-diphosphate-sugar epimerase